MGNSHPNMIDPDGGFGWPFGMGYTASNPFLGTAGVGGGGTSGLQILGTTAGILGVAALGNAFAFANALADLNSTVAQSTKSSNNKVIAFNSKKDQPLYFKAAENYSANGGDDDFYFFGHASNKGFEWTDSKGKFHRNYSAQAFNEAMSDLNPNWKKAMAEKREITVTLFACNMASQLKGGDNIAAKISKAFPNVTVKAPDGYVINGLTMGKPSIHGVENDARNGGFITIKKGVIISKTNMPYNRTMPKKVR